MLHPVERLAARQFVQHAGGALADHAFHPRQIAGCDNRTDRLAALAMIRLVHLDEARPFVALDLVLQPDAAQFPLRREHLMVHRHRHDVLVPGHRPVRTEMAVGGVVHRILAAQPLEIRLVHVVLVEFRDADIDLVERLRVSILARVETDVSVHGFLLSARLGWLQCCPSGINPRFPRVRGVLPIGSIFCRKAGSLLAWPSGRIARTQLDLSLRAKRSNLGRVGRDDRDCRARPWA